MGRVFVLLASVLLAGCEPIELEVYRGERGDACMPASLGDGEMVPCREDLTCDPVQDTDGYECAVPMEIHGRVIDALSGAPIAGAAVAAFDAGGAPVSRVVRTGPEGNYELPVSATRDGRGDVTAGQQWTLFAAAAGYQPFPGGIRPALPLDSTEIAGVEGEQASVLENPTTTVALVPLLDQGGVTIQGVAGGEEGAGTLVVAEGVSRQPHAVADLSGEYILFNVPSGEATIRGYRRGIQLEPASVSIGTADMSGVDLAVVEDQVDALGTVSGSVNIVDAPMGAQTSVVLVPVSVYDEGLERGPVPFGLRAPEPPQAPSITNVFTIAGVPAGSYKVLAAFENDDLVRDPDTSIAGTQIQEVMVTPGQTVELQSAFKVTEALEIVGPGKTTPEQVGSTPTFAWHDDASEDHYDLVVLDAFGRAVWEQPMIQMSSTDTVEVRYGGPALEPGMVYQFRVTAFRSTPQSTTAISRTEELRGLFIRR